MYNDSRDIIAAFEDAEAERTEYADALALLPADISDDAKDMLMRHTDWSTDQEEEWEMLKQACEFGDDNITDWQRGAQLIPIRDFDGDYAEELCRDLGYTSHNFPNWIEIDWKATAENLKADYTEVELCNEAYYVRS